MWGWLSLVACLSGPLMGLGRPEGLLLRKGGWLLLLLLACVAGGGGGWLVRVGVGDTPAAACVWWWWVPPFLRAWCVWGWHAVGVLGQCALGCPARPGFHFLGFWVGVGGLVVNCIVDASILL